MPLGYFHKKLQKLAVVYILGNLPSRDHQFAVRVSYALYAIYSKNVELALLKAVQLGNLIRARIVSSEPPNLADLLGNLIMLFRNIKIYKPNFFGGM